MARIAGINLQNHKHIWIALTSVYGIGDTRAKMICEKVGIQVTKKVKDLEEKELEIIRQFIEEYQLEGDLRRENSINIKQLTNNQKLPLPNIKNLRKWINNDKKAS